MKHPMPTHLHCEYLQNPRGIDWRAPRLSWELEHQQSAIARGLNQTAYQILVASSDALLKEDKGDLWDSGRMASDRQNQVEYAGTPLASRQQCFWKVRVWTAVGSSLPSAHTSPAMAPSPSAWSSPGSWSMGLLVPADWQARWIGVSEPSRAEWAKPRYLRTTFPVSNGVRRATVYAGVESGRA